LRILAIDVGAGTQDVLIYESDREPENCVKLVLPSQTQVLARRLRRATAAGRPVHLSGTLMGGGAVTDAGRDHLATGLPLTATPQAALTFHNDPDRVRRLGVEIRDDAPAEAVEIALRDVDWAELRTLLRPFEIELPRVVAIAVQDHGYRPGAGNNEIRFEYLQSLIDGGGDLARLVYREPPAEMTRMAAVRESLSFVEQVYLMDTGAAAVLGALGDPVVARAVEESGAILVNVGNMHTFAVLVRGRRLFGLFEHHTGGIGPFPFVAVTGPNRRLARPLGYHQAAPHGDMMLAGAFGLVAGVRLAMES
jgi:uncharacterized protein (DUF1786 family)